MDRVKPTATCSLIPVVDLRYSVVLERVYLNRYFAASFVAPLPNSEQINRPSSNHTYTKSTQNHIHHHYAPFVTLRHTRHTLSLQLQPHMHHVVTPRFADIPHWSKRTAGQMDGKTGWKTPPTSKCQGICSMGSLTCFGEVLEYGFDVKHSTLTPSSEHPLR